MYTIIHGEKILQYKIELDLSGMTYSGSPDSISTSAEERLKWLKNHQSNWFRFRSDSKELMDFGDDFIGDRGDFLSVISGDIVAFGISNLQTSTTSLAFRNLREPAKNIHGVNSKLSFEFFTRELAVDPSQDLVILISEGGPLRPTNGMKVTINIHIRNISTGTYHGMANHDTLVHVLSCSSILWYRYSISIWHQFVGVHCQRIVDDEQSFEFSELLVWDWKTGQKEMHLIDLIASFTFLSDYHVLLALPAIPDTSLSQTPMLVVIDFHKTSTNFTTVLGFSLPEFRRTAHISTLRFHAEVPRVGSSASEQTILNHHHTASNNRVILLSVQRHFSRTRSGVECHASRAAHNQLFLGMHGGSMAPGC
ncbi:hypothetical protein BD410DRAFT_786704 [Rickenella mellea]|uniref:Uncharacterized protein n=1 Tax=Rickenella mellea TaxID=50990 RepID=A0A4Y7Q9G2_9AGAM|nr:hypothetical protein BD410DRAFT_786704 [Rickenella mellea]